MHKNKSDLRIIFLGNPEFARFHLARILDEGYNVVAVVCAPDKPAGRGMKLLATPVTEYAREKNIPCLQPANLKNPDFLEELKGYHADLQIVIAFRMLPELVWDMPSMGTFNLHASLLPHYRGAAPINWAIINGETITGVSTFKLKHEIDTGNLLVQKSCAILPEDNAGTLHDKLMHLGTDAIVETLEQVLNSELKEIPQHESEEDKNAPKLHPANTELQWDRKGSDIVNLVRGLSPYPLAHSTFDHKKMKVYKASFYREHHTKDIGSFVTDGKSYLGVWVTDGMVHLDEIKIEGKRQMKIKDFLNGYEISHLKIKEL